MQSARVVLDVVGLTPELLGEHTPNSARARASRARCVRSHRSRRRSPARCSRRSSTGLLPREHGIVGNGWYFRDLAEVWLWRQSNQLVARREDLGGGASGATRAFTCAKLFWWYNMYSTRGLRRSRRARCTRPTAASSRTSTREPAELRDELQRASSAQFPLFNFWGPRADIASSRWIADCARHVYDDEAADADARLPAAPRLRPAAPRARATRASPRTCARSTRVCGELIEHVRARRARGSSCSRSTASPTVTRRRPHQPRAPRGGAARGARRSSGASMLDAGRVARRSRSPTTRSRTSTCGGRERIARGAAPRREARPASSACSTRTGKRAAGLDHPRSGELVAISRGGSLVHATTTGSTTRARPTSRAPSTSTASPATTRSSCSSIPTLALPQLKVGWTLAQEGARLPLPDGRDPARRDLVKGSHGRPTDDLAAGPVLISSERDLLPHGPIEATAVKSLLLDHVFGR